MEKIPRIILSVLVTREEYSKASAEFQRKERSHVTPIITAAGAILFILGIAGAFFGKFISLSFSAAFCLILLGVFLVCYNGFFAPLLDSAAAAREYDEKEDLHFVTNYQFTDDSVIVSNGRVKGDLPLDLITKWSETPALIIFAYGRELSFAVPKRLLTPEQNELLQKLLLKNAEHAKL